MTNSLSNKEHLFSYLAGLFEACCSIYTPKENSKNGPKLIFSLGISNESLGQIIKTRLGFGNVYIKKKNVTYAIANKEGILKVIEIISPYMKTPKINKLNALIEFLNKNKNCNISKVEIDNSDLFSNAWLSGWLETNGSFFLRINEKMTQLHQPLCHFMLSHIKVDKDNNSYEPFLLKLSEKLGVNLLEHNLKSSGRKYSAELNTNKNLFFLIAIIDKNNLLRLLNYLYYFPLYGIQFIRYYKFGTVGSKCPKGKFYQAYQIKYIEKIEEGITIKELLDIFRQLRNGMINIDNSSKLEQIEHLELFPKLD